MDWLDYITGALDKPGAAVRGVLSGELDDALHLIPFSDTLGITQADDRKSGRDMLEAWGAVGPNTAGLDAGDVAGTLAELLLDPTNYIGLGTIGKGARFLKGEANFRRALPELAAGVRPAMQGDYWGMFDSPNQLWDAQKAQADDILRRDYRLGSLEDAWRAKGTIGGQLLYRGEQVPSKSYAELGRTLNVNNASLPGNDPRLRLPLAQEALADATNRVQELTRLRDAAATGDGFVSQPQLDRALQDASYYRNHLLPQLQSQADTLARNDDLIFASTSPDIAASYAGDTGAVFKLMHNPRRQWDMGPTGRDGGPYTDPTIVAARLKQDLPGIPESELELRGGLGDLYNQPQWKYLRDDALNYLRPVLERQGVSSVRHRANGLGDDNVAILDRNSAALFNEMTAATRLPPARNPYDLTQQLIGGAPPQPRADVRPWYARPTDNIISQARAHNSLIGAFSQTARPPSVSLVERMQQLMERGDRGAAAELYQRLKQMSRDDILQTLAERSQRLGREFDPADQLDVWQDGMDQIRQMLSNPEAWFPDVANDTL